MRFPLTQYFRVACALALFFLLNGLSIVSLNYQSPEIMEPGERSFNLGISGAFLDGSFDPGSEELQLGTRIGRSQDTDYGIKLYISSGEGRLARGFGVFADGKFFGFENSLFTFSTEIGLSYSRCRLKEFEDLTMNDMFGFHGSLFLGKRLLYGGFRENIEFTLTSSNELALRQHIGFFIGSTIGKKWSVTPEICYYYGGIGRDYHESDDDFLAGLGFQYSFK